MNADTVRTVNTIIYNGWYRKETTLGEGGWGKIPKWNKYILESNDNHIQDEIHAIDDETAQKAFQSIYDFDKITDWDIFQVITEYRLIGSSLQDTENEKI